MPTAHWAKVAVAVAISQSAMTQALSAIDTVLARGRQRRQRREQEDCHNENLVDGFVPDETALGLDGAGAVKIAEEGTDDGE
eukprot:COSAG01_NODE_10082_length_2253_cov_11.910399_1_plen_81_part_10